MVGANNNSPLVMIASNGGIPHGHMTAWKHILHGRIAIRPYELTYFSTNISGDIISTDGFSTPA